MSWFYIGITQIALDPPRPPICQTGKRGKFCLFVTISLTLASHIQSWAHHMTKKELRTRPQGHRSLEHRTLKKRYGQFSDKVQLLTPSLSLLQFSPPSSCKGRPREQKQYYFTHFRHPPHSILAWRMSFFLALYRSEPIDYFNVELGCVINYAIWNSSS